MAVAAVASAAGEPGTTATIGTSVRALAPESGNTVIAVGSSGPSMLVQRIAADGNAGTAFSAGSGVARGVAVQSDGKIVVAGNDSGAVVRRFNPDGSPDASFGSGGTRAIPGLNLANTVAVAPCNQIVVGGTVTDTAGPDQGYDFVGLARLNASDGALDAGFDGDGVARLGLGRNSQANGIAVQGDGKIVVAGRQIPDSQVPNGLVARANSDGTLDGSFGNGAFPGGATGPGVLFYWHPFGGANSAFNAVTFDSQGRIVVAGTDLDNEGAGKAILGACRPTAPSTRALAPTASRATRRRSTTSAASRSPVPARSRSPVTASSPPASTRTPARATPRSGS